MVATVTTPTPAISINITTPQNGASISGATVAVFGTFQGSPNSGINVNGTVAATLGNQFVAVVSVVAGTNQITVTSTAQDGTIATQSLTITATGTPPAVQLKVEPNVGVAPHQVTVTIPAIPNRTSAQTQIDFNGDGIVDTTVNILNTTVAYTYPAAGIYLAKTTLNDNAGGIYTQTFPIVVGDVVTLDTMLKGIFTGMLGKLKTGDIQDALKAFTPSAVEQYRPVFEDLGPNLATAVDQFGTIVDGAISEEFAEYVLVRNKGAGKQAYLIYFFRGGDGVWRISQM